jgi:hypothetical protein
LHGTVATKRILNLSPLPFLKGKPLPFSLPFFSFILPHPLLRARLLSRPNSARPSSADIARAIHRHCAPAHMHQYRRISLQPEACSTIMHNHFNRRQTAIHMLNHAWIITKNIQMYIRSSHNDTSTINYQLMLPSRTMKGGRGCQPTNSMPYDPCMAHAVACTHMVQRHPPKHDHCTATLLQVPFGANKYNDQNGMQCPCILNLLPSRPIEDPTAPIHRPDQLSWLMDHAFAFLCMVLG